MVGSTTIPHSWYQLLSSGFYCCAKTATYSDVGFCLFACFLRIAFCFLEIFDMHSFFCILSVLTLIDHGYFLFWCHLFGVLWASCTCVCVISYFVEFNWVFLLKIWPCKLFRIILPHLCLYIEFFKVFNCLYPLLN